MLTHGPDRARMRERAADGAGKTAASTWQWRHRATCSDHEATSTRHHRECWPCTRDLGSSQARIDAGHACIKCLLHSNSAFFVGRTGFGMEVWAGCLAAFPPNGSTAIGKRELSGWSTILRPQLVKENGIITSDDADALSYGRCYAAAVNRSDAMVRQHNRTALFDKESSKCKGCECGWWYDNRVGSMLRTDRLLLQSGHFPGRIVVADVVESAWSRVDDKSSSWLSALEGKTVLVVHPFNVTIASQLARPGGLFWQQSGNAVASGSITWKLVRPPVNFAGSVEHSSWQAALEDLIDSVDAVGHFDVALLACGGLGMPLGAHLRATGRSSIYIGGTLQLLFGIRGGRWSHRYNSYMSSHAFVCPSRAEMPPSARNYSINVDNGAYWC